MGEYEQISLVPDLGGEIEEEDRVRKREEENLVESLLFSLGRSVSVEEIATCLNMGKDGAFLAAERLRERYEERQEGLLIKKLEDRYQMVSHPKTYEGLIRVVKRPQKPVLSDVALETLSIIAYCQPITKVEVERIRGVKSDHAVNRLVEFGLIEEVGRLEAPGRPMLFARGISVPLRCKFFKGFARSSGRSGETLKGRGYGRIKRRLRIGAG